ncbi:MAG: hypothetical protein HRF45_11870 [Fimbriimonadia bacterium]|jgi:flagellar basal body-associated protein FliL
MKKSNSNVVAIVALVVILVAAYFLYQSLAGGTSAGTEGVVLPEDPRKTDPNFDPNRNRPPDIGGVGGPAQGN